MLKYIGWLAHVYTSLGILCAVLALKGVLENDLYLAATAIIISTVVDMTDGTLARYLNVEKNIPFIDGTRMDALIDYLNITFIPLFLMFGAGWLPEPAWIWVVIAATTGVFNYSTVKLNVHRDGFIYGFPAIYSILVVYIILMDLKPYPLLLAFVLIVASILELLPIRFARPRDALKFRWFFIHGGFFWMISIGFMWFKYPDVPTWLFYVSLIYPIAYVPLSIYLDIYARKLRKFSLRD